MSVPILILHAPGSPAGGSPWAEAMGAARWRGETIAIDLPGHGMAPAAVGGHFDFVDPAFIAIEKLGMRLHDDGFVVVGIGASGWAATVLALADTSQALVLVDGVGAPFLSTDDRAERRRNRLRAYAETAAAPADDGPDPRLDIEVLSHHSLDVALEAAGELKVPTLLLESPASEATSEEIEQIVAANRNVKTQSIASNSPADVAAAVTAWCDTLTLESGF